MAKATVLPAAQGTLRAQGPNITSPWASKQLQKLEEQEDDGCW